MTVLSEAAEIAQEIDVEIAREMAKKAEKAMSAFEEHSTEFENAQQDLEKALNRLRIAEGKKER